jgi:ketol-acid reductoisomerase
MEKPKQQKTLSFAEYKERRKKQNRVEDLGKKNIIDMVKLIQDGQVTDAELQELKQFSNDEIFLLQHLLNEIEEGKFLKESLEELQAHSQRVEEYSEMLQEEIEDLNARLREK